MRKYNVGDKFVIEIEEICDCSERNVLAEPHTLYRAKGFNSLVFDESELDKLQKLNPELKIEDIDDMLAEYDLRQKEYERGLNDAWELMKKVLLPVGSGGIETEQLNNIFDVPSTVRASHWILKEFTPQEALTKLEAYEKSKAKPTIGDIILQIDRARQFLIITEETGDDEYDFGVIDLKHMRVDRIPWGDKNFVKTGKHIDISAILAEIGKE